MAMETVVRIDVRAIKEGSITRCREHAKIVVVVHGVPLASLGVLATLEAISLGELFGDLDGCVVAESERVAGVRVASDITLRDGIIPLKHVRTIAITIKTNK